MKMTNEAEGAPLREAPLGFFQYAVLKAVRACDSDAYGVGITRRLVETFRVPIDPAQVYVCLKRLETRGFIASEEATVQRSARDVRVYTVTEEGAHALASTDALLSVIATLETQGASARRRPQRR